MKLGMLFSFSLLLLGVPYLHDCVAAGTATTPHKCESDELVQGDSTYNDAVCAGIQAMNSGNIKLAIDLLEKASSKKLLDSPNYKLFPRLAEAYLKSGDENKARLYLEKSRLALSLAVGIMHCQETDSGFYVAQFSSSKVDSPVNKDVATVMCGAAYDDFYEGRTLKGTLSDSKLIESYLNIAKKFPKTPTA